MTQIYKCGNCNELLWGAGESASHDCVIRKVRKDDLLTENFEVLRVGDWIEGLGFIESIGMLETVRFMGKALQEECQEVQNVADRIQEEIDKLQKKLTMVAEAAEAVCNNFMYCTLDNPMTEGILNLCRALHKAESALK